MSFPGRKVIRPATTSIKTLISCSITLLFIIVPENHILPLKMIKTGRLLCRIRSTRVLSTPSSRPLSRIAVRLPRISVKVTSPFANNNNAQRNFSQKVELPPEDSSMDLKLYDNVCTETLEELNDYFEEVLENTSCLDSVPDVLYSVTI